MKSFGVLADAEPASFNGPLPCAARGLSRRLGQEVRAKAFALGGSSRAAWSINT